MVDSRIPLLCKALREGQSDPSRIDAALATIHPDTPAHVLRHCGDVVEIATRPVHERALLVAEFTERVWPLESVGKVESAKTRLNSAGCQFALTPVFDSGRLLGIQLVATTP